MDANRRRRGREIRRHARRFYERYQRQVYYDGPRDNRHDWKVAVATARDLCQHNPNHRGI